MVVGHAYPVKEGGLQDRFEESNRLLAYEFDYRKLRKNSWNLVKEKNRSGFEQAKIKVLLVGNSHGKDMFNAFYQNKDLFYEYDFMHYDIQISCFDDQNIDNEDSANKFFASKRYKQTDIVVVSTRYYIDPCDRKKGSIKKLSDLIGLPDLIERAKSDRKGILIFGNATEYGYRNGRLISDDYFLRLIEEDNLTNTLVGRRKYGN